VIRRVLHTALLRAATKLPVVTLTGPRQSGKTTLCRSAFPDKAYVNLEPLDVREFARTDPRGFLAEVRQGAILDEIQNVPELLSYIQAEVDEDPSPGRFILTGSQQLAANEAVSQTLAGRTAILHLLPFSLDERRQTDSWEEDLWVDVFRGGYPRIYDRRLDPARWYADYITTYVERDVRQVKDIGELRAFRTFPALAAGRTAQEINLSALGGDAGVSHNTARAWLSVLDASFLITSIPAWHRNVRKQIIKAPKLHFLDTGIACSLLGIRHPDQLRSHPLRGPLFESWVAAEILKALLHSGRHPDLKHYRESRGAEIDLVVQQPGKLHVIECRSGATIDASFLDSLSQFRSSRPALVYGGRESHPRRAIPVYSWKDIDRLGRQIAAE